MYPEGGRVLRKARGRWHDGECGTRGPSERSLHKGRQRISVSGNVLQLL